MNYRRGMALFTAGALAVGLLAAGAAPVSAQAAGDPEYLSERSSLTGSGNSRSTSGRAAKGNVVEQAYRDGTIENNGGLFVGVGDRVYFREQDAEHAYSPAMWGEFLTQPESATESRILYYDSITGKTREAFEDSGYGAFFAGNGGFYLNRIADDGLPEVYWMARTDPRRE